MALLDRLKDAAKPTNSIEPVPPPAPEPGRQEPRLTPPAATSAAAAPAPTPAKAPVKDQAPAYASEPEAISRAYYVEGRGAERRYFDDYQRKALAIRADDTSITSKREDLTTIRAMLTMAEARGWGEVRVSGSAAFRREAWIEAAALGITAQGYKAGDLDRQEADRRRAERGPQQGGTMPVGGNEVRRAGPSPQPAPDAPVRPVMTAPEPAQPRRLPEPAAPRPVKLEVVAGQERAAPETPVPPTPADHRRTLREAEAVLSDNGRLMLAALGDTIDRKMNKLNAEAKAEMKAFAATELVKKERTDGPIVLTREQVELSRAPQPAPRHDNAPERNPEAPRQAPRVVRDGPEPERPRRTRSR